MLKLAPILAAAIVAQQPGMPQRESRTGLIVGQVLDAGTGRPIAGALVEISGEPIVAVTDPRARAMGNPPVAPALLTASDGRFVFRRLPAARYTLTAAKAGYLDGSYGRRRPEGASQTFLLADGQKAGGVRIYLFRPAAITGVVLDEAGEPVIGIQVRALRRTLVAGQRRFAYAGAVGWTDDRGIYRVGGLGPGDYMVAATATQVSVAASTAQEARISSLPPAVAEIGASTVSGPTSMQVGESILTLGRSAIGPPPASDARLFVYPTTFHPDTANPVKATVFAVGSGEERGGIDLHLLAVPTRRVSGVVVTADGQANGVPVRIVPEDADDSPLGLEVASTVTNRTGGFNFPAVPVGNYLLRAVSGVPLGGLPGSTTTVHTAGGISLSSVERMNPGMLTYGFPLSRWGSMPLAVGREDVGNVSLRLQTGLRVAGRVEFEGSGPRPPARLLSQLSLTVVPASATSQLPSLPVRVEASGQFSVYGLPGGLYRLIIGSPPGTWQLKSAVWNGRDVYDSVLYLEDGDVTGIALTFTDRPTEVSGSVRDASGNGDSGATVVVFPADAQAWGATIVNPSRFRSVRVSPAGAYTIHALPPGDYSIVAIPEEQSADWQDPRTLEALSRTASALTIAGGDKKTQDLRTREIR